MPSPHHRVDTFVELPDPGQATTLDDLVERLRLLKVWADNPSYEWIKDRVNASWTAAGRPAGELAGKTTIVDCFRPGRRRLKPDLIMAVVQALHPDVGYVTQWRQALQVIGGQAKAAAQVRVQDTLPRAPAGFTGRTSELDWLQRALHQGTGNGGTVVISAIAGMAGVGKTQLAIHAGHLLAHDQSIDRILFVDLRGFHPDLAQPPADPVAVLEAFLRLLGVPGHQIPHDLAARTAAYRRRLDGTHTLVVLDNAANEDQVRPLLPETPGCPALVTSRRSLTGLHLATHLTVDVFTPGEALEFLTRAAPQVPVGPDPNAAARIARRCGYLPLALGLVTAHIRGTPGWTLTDHAERLDEHHGCRRLDSGVELALKLSYQHLPADRQRLLRLAALHPGQDLDAYAAAALADGALSTVRTHLHQLCRDHLLQQRTPGRYTFHDVIHAYAAGRASDVDPPPERRDALTRLFDYYLATTATAMDTLYPAEAHRRPRIPPPGTPTPTLSDPDTARTWLDTERPTLVAVAAHTAAHNLLTHTIGLSTTLFRYLAGGYHTDALTVHGHARHAAQHTNDRTGQAHAQANTGIAHLRLGQYGPAAEHLKDALHLFQLAGDPVGQARALGNLGNIEGTLGRYGPATEYHKQVLALSRQVGDATGEVDALNNLGIIEARLGRNELAAEYHERALVRCRQAGDRTGEAWVLNNLGEAEARLGRYGPAIDHLLQALALCRDTGDRTGEAWVLDSLGILHTHRGQPAQANDHHQQAMAIFHETGQRNGEAWTLNGLGEAARTSGRPADALTRHTAAHTIASDIGDRFQHARAHTGLGHAHHTLSDPGRARHHYQHALTLYTDLGMPEADRIRAHLNAIQDNGREQR
ncbi:MAG: ATP-binding protein [Labedaea sp.]